MSHIIACIDGSIYTHSVLDHAAWAAQKLSASIEVLQVLGRREVAPTDLSGNISVDTQQHLLNELAQLDAQRAKLIQQRARMIMDDARLRLSSAGVQNVTTVLRNGDLLETLSDRETSADIIVIGKRGEAADFASAHLGSNLERVVRASHRPILVASRAFTPIRKALVAFDGGPSVLKAVDALSRSQLMRDVDIHFVFVGSETVEVRRRLEGAVAQLGGGGHRAAFRFESGVPDKAIAGIVEAEQMNLLIMGAYGHSRIRRLLIGSTTTEMVRSCKVPVLLFR
ncbi:MAG: universal stress protein [Hyphomicrobiaceae bacterium]